MSVDDVQRTFRILLAPPGQLLADRLLDTLPQVLSYSSCGASMFVLGSDRWEVVRSSFTKRTCATL